MVKDRTYYDLLGISVDADKKAIKKGYRKMALKYHPDRAPEEKKKEFEEKFKKVSEAYQVLSDDEKKKLYDQYGVDGLKYGGSSSGGPGASQFTFTTSGGPGSGFSFMDANDLFNQMRGGGLFDDFFGGRSSGRDEFGGGFDGFGGFGSRTGGFTSGFPSNFQKPQKQPVYEHETFVTLKNLYNCKTKKIRMNLDGQRRQFAFDLKPGVKDGTKVTFNGEDSSQPTVKFVVRIADDPQYTKEGYNIIYKKRISLTEALLGTHVQVPLLSEQSYHINLSNQVIHPEYIYKIQGEGLPAPPGKPRGDMLVKFIIDFPRALNSHQKEVIAQLHL